MQEKKLHGSAGAVHSVQCCYRLLEVLTSECGGTDYTINANQIGKELHVGESC